MTDAQLGLDGKPLAAERNPYRVARAAPKPPTRRRRADLEAQQERLRTLTAEGYVVKVGKTGVTVFLPHG